MKGGKPMNVYAAIAGSVATGAALGLGSVVLARAKDEPGTNAADAFLEFAPSTTAWAGANLGVLGGAALLSTSHAHVGVRAGGAALLTLGAASYGAFATSLFTGR